MRENARKTDPAPPPVHPSNDVEVLSSAKADVLEFCRRLGVVCAAMTEAQCRTLQHSGVLTALHATLVAIRSGQIGSRLTPSSVVRALKTLFQELSEGGET